MSVFSHFFMSVVMYFVISLFLSLALSLFYLVHFLFRSILSKFNDLSPAVCSSFCLASLVLSSCLSFFSCFLSVFISLFLSFSAPFCLGFGSLRLMYFLAFPHTPPLLQKKSKQKQGPLHPPTNSSMLVPRNNESKKKPALNVKQS